MPCSTLEWQLGHLPTSKNGFFLSVAFVRCDDAHRQIQPLMDISLVDKEILR